MYGGSCSRTCTPTTPAACTTSPQRDPHLTRRPEGLGPSARARPGLSEQPLPTLARPHGRGPATRTVRTLPAEHEPHQGGRRQVPPATRAYPVRRFLEVAACGRPRARSPVAVRPRGERPKPHVWLSRRTQPTAPSSASPRSRTILFAVGVHDLPVRSVDRPDRLGIAAAKPCPELRVGRRAGSDPHNGALI
jgi:hypothetical protein